MNRLNLRKHWKLAATLAVIVVLIAVVVVKISLASREGETRRGFAPVVHAEPPALSTVTSKLILNGDVLAIRLASIYSKVSGGLERNYADMGSRVREGQILATIDSTELVQQVQQMSATYQNARETYARQVQLFEKTLSARQDLDNAEAAMKVADANYATAKTRLGYARIAAPFRGIITRRYLDPGALVNATSSTLFTLMDLDTVRIIVNVPEKEVAKIFGIGQADVTLDALPGRRFVGRVTRFSQAVDLTTRTMPVEVRVPNPGNEIKPGMFATIALVLSSRPNAITIASNIVLRDENGTYVYVLNDGRARRVRVALGQELDSRFEVQSGLSAGDSVIVAGQQFARDGGPVTVK